jgi:hypothetical protein
MTQKIWITTALLLLLSGAFVYLNPPPRLRAVPRAPEAARIVSPNPPPTAKVAPTPSPTAEPGPLAAMSPPISLESRIEGDFIPADGVELLPPQPGVLGLRVKGQIYNIPKDSVVLGPCPSSNRFLPNARCFKIRPGLSVEATRKILDNLGLGPGAQRPRPERFQHTDLRGGSK